MKNDQRLRRLGLLGDIHAQNDRVAVALAHLRQVGISDVLSVGDIVDGPGDLGETVRLLQDARVRAVAGNHERWFRTGRMRDLPAAHVSDDQPDYVCRFLAGLPAVRTFDTVMGRALLCHGIGDDDMGMLVPDFPDAMIEELPPLRTLMREGFEGAPVRVMMGGHTHLRMVRRAGTMWVVNPGTLLSLREPGGFAIVDFERQQVRFFVFDDDNRLTAEPAISLAAEPEAAQEPPHTPRVRP